MEFFLLWKRLFFLRGNGFFSCIDNDFLEMFQRMRLTYFDEWNAVTSHVFEMSWSQITL